MKEAALDFLHQYIAAIRSFTRVPVTGAPAASAGPHTEARAAHLPGVGYLVGGAACITFALLGVLLQGSAFVPFAAAVGSTIATMLLTGMIHEEGLARWAGSAGSPQLGARGTAAMTMALLAKIALLAVLGEQSAAGVLVAIFAGHTLSRLAPVVLAARLAPLGDSDTRKPLIERARDRELWIGAAWCVPPLLLAVFAIGVGFAMIAVLAAAAAFWGMLRLIHRRFRGYTANCLHATQQACELAFYLGAAVGWSLS